VNKGGNAMDSRQNVAQIVWGTIIIVCSLVALIYSINAYYNRYFEIVEGKQILTGALIFFKGQKYLEDEAITKVVNTSTISFLFNSYNTLLFVMSIIGLFIGTDMLDRRDPMKRTKAFLNIIRAKLHR
jgi:hypothetical protein